MVIFDLVNLWALKAERYAIQLHFRMKRFWRFVFDVPIFLICYLTHRTPPHHPLSPNIVLHDGVTLCGYTIIIDNRGNTTQPVIVIEGSHVELKHVHMRVLDTPKFMIQIPDTHENNHPIIKT